MRWPLHPLTSLVHFFIGSHVLGKLAGSPGAELSPGLCRSERGLGKHLMYLFSLGIKFNQFLLAFSWKMGR